MILRSDNGTTNKKKQHGKGLFVFTWLNDGRNLLSYKNRLLNLLSYKNRCSNYLKLATTQCLKMMFKPLFSK